MVFKASPRRPGRKKFWGVSVAQPSARMVSALAMKANALRAGRPDVGKTSAADTLRAALE